MKITDIKADGTVYWWHRSNQWGSDAREGYDQRQAVRVNDERYTTYGYNNTIRQDDKGRYVAVRFPAAWGVGPRDNWRTDDKVHYVLASQIRAPYEEVKASADKYDAARKVAADKRRTGYEQAVDKAAEARDRLTDLGIDGLFGVRALEGYEGGKYRPSSEPRVEIKFAGTPDDLIALAKRLEAAERLAKTLDVPGGYAVGGPKNADGTYATWGLPNA